MLNTRGSYLINNIKELIEMILHTIIFTGKSGDFEMLYPDIINKQIKVPLENVDLSLPTDYEQRRISDISVKLSYNMPTQNIEWLNDVDMSRYKVQDVYCRFSEEGHEDIYQCVYCNGRPFSGQPSNTPPVLFKEN